MQIESSELITHIESMRNKQENPVTDGYHIGLNTCIDLIKMLEDKEMQEMSMWYEKERKHGKS